MANCGDLPLQILACLTLFLQGAHKQGVLEFKAEHSKLDSIRNKGMMLLGRKGIEVTFLIMSQILILRSYFKNSLIC